MLQKWKLLNEVSNLKLGIRKFAITKNVQQEAFVSYKTSYRPLFLHLLFIICCNCSSNCPDTCILTINKIDALMSKNL